MIKIDCFKRKNKFHLKIGLLKLQILKFEWRNLRNSKRTKISHLIIVSKFNLITKWIVEGKLSDQDNALRKIDSDIRMFKMQINKQNFSGDSQSNKQSSSIGANQEISS